MNLPPETIVRAGKWDLSVLRVGSRYVVRVSNGMALTLGAKKPNYEALIAAVANGEKDEEITRLLKQQ